MQGSVTVTTPFPDGNLANRDERWDFITGDTLPTYLELVRDEPEAVRALVASSMADRVADERIPARIDDIVGEMLEWEVDVDQ